MPEEPMTEDLEDEDGAPTAEVPSRGTPEDKEADTVETPTMEKKPSGKPRRRGMSASDKVKLWIILTGPIVFILVVAGLFVIEQDGVSLGKRAWVTMFGGEIIPPDRGGAKIPAYRELIQKAEGEARFYSGKLDEIEKEYKAIPAGDREQLIPMNQKCQDWTEALGGIVSQFDHAIETVEKDWESRGKEVNPSSAELKEAKKTLEPVMKRARELAVEIDRKAWEVGQKVPPPSDDTPIIESGGGHKKKEEEKKD